MSCSTHRKCLCVCVTVWYLHFTLNQQKQKIKNIRFTHSHIYCTAAYMYTCIQINMLRLPSIFTINKRQNAKNKQILNKDHTHRHLKNYKPRPLTTPTHRKILWMCRVEEIGSSSRQCPCSVQQVRAFTLGRGKSSKHTNSLS